jgi:hypothetical protein
VLGLDTWRATFAKIAGDEAPHDAGLLGLSLGLGLVLGRFLLLSPQPLLGTTDLRSILIYELPWNVLLLIILFFFFRWIAAGASVWLEVAATRRTPRLIYTSGLVIASIILIIWLEHLISYRDLSNIILQESFSVSAVIDNLKPQFLEVTLQQVSTFLAFVCLWAFPLAVSIWRERRATVAASSWAFLGSSSQTARWSVQEPLRPRLAMIVGLVGGLIYWFLLLLVEIWRNSYVSAAIKNTDQFHLWFALILLMGGAVLQAIVAAIVTVWVRRLGVLQGLFAAFFAGCIMTTALCVNNLLEGTSIDLVYIGTVLGWMVNGGAILAMLTALVVSALTGWIRYKPLQYPPS